MKIYIGYKLSNLTDSDKTQLKPLLESISSKLESLGHSTFLMGRDVQNWSKEYNPSYKTLFQILRHMNAYDALFAFVNSSVPSLGLRFETLMAKVLTKKIFLFIKDGENDSFLNILSNKKMFFSDTEDLFRKIDEVFNKVE